MLQLTQLTAENYLFVHEHGAIEIADETAIFYNDTIHGILSQPPTGEVIEFTGQVEFKCDCEEDCNTALLVACDGHVGITKDGGECFVAKIDPRYCSRIYEVTC